MLSIDCCMDRTGGKEDNTRSKEHVKLRIYESELSILDKTISFTSIKSVHVKNEGGYYLKVKTGDPTPSIVLEFGTVHIRDMAKNIILDRVRMAEDIAKKIVESNIDYRRILKNIKGVIKSPESLVKHIDRHESLYFQKEMSFSPESFFSSMSQPLMDVFIKMNCSIEQFYNLLTNSYFFDIKNQKNSLDRLLSESLRAESSHSYAGSTAVGLDYPTRINSYSLLNLVETVDCPSAIKHSKSKQIEFEPECSLLSTPVATGRCINTGGHDVIFETGELSAELPVLDQHGTPFVTFDESDFEAARDLCKLVHASDNKDLIGEAIKFSETLKNLVEGKYGKEALGYVERLLPVFYCRLN